MSVRRRDLLHSAAFGAALAGGVSGRLPAGERALPLDPLEAHVRMRCNLDGGRTYWFYTGTVFGNVIGQSTRPMLGVEGISFSLLEQLPGGRYRYSLTEAGYYLDAETRTLEDAVANPFTGEMYRPEHYLSSQTNIFAPDLSVTPELEFKPPGLEYRGVITPLRTFKDVAWSAEDIFVRIPSPALGEGQDRPTHKVQTSLATLTADLHQLRDPDLDFVDCQLNYQTLGTWRDWMAMGTIPGVISWRMVGTKCSEPELPAYLVDRIAADHEGFFDG